MLTVPASFDAAARELTVEAALAAGIENLTLLEEPQAALYAWIDAHGDAWRKEIDVGDVILVVDVGGGTTDFSAIAAVEKDGSLELARVAVGDHILLGGDNMDLALAHVVRQKLDAEGKEVDRWQMSALTHACRAAKERLLGDATLASAPIAIAGARLGAPRRRPARRAHARRGDADAGRRLLPRGRRSTRARSPAPAAASRSSGCRTRPTRRSPGTSPRSSRQAGATAKLEGFAAPGAATRAIARRSSCTRPRSSSTAA